MSQETSKLNDIMFIIVPTLFLLVVNQWFFFFSYFGQMDAPWLEQFNRTIYTKPHIIRATFILFIALGTVTNLRLRNQANKSWLYLIGAAVTIFLFMRGFSTDNFYNLYAYPIVLFTAIFFTVKTVQYVSTNNKTDNKKIVAKTKKAGHGFVFPTAEGDLFITKPQMGIGIEGGAGAGKSVLIKRLLAQAGMKGFAGVLYDFEGDCREPDGAELTRTIMTSIRKYNQTSKKEGKLSFAYLNFGDPTRTVRVNPLNPKYIDSALDLKEFAITLMTNLEPEWLKKKDFWASNAINYADGILRRLYNDEELHRYMTIPHLAMICTHDYETVFNWMLQDPSLERQIMPLYVAYKEEAKQQLAGAVSSAALPITKILDPRIFYPLSPQSESEELSLDITNAEDPVFLSLGTIPKNKFALGPVCSLILLVCMNNMNQFGKRKSLFVCDELPTLFIPNLDTLPATARKKDVSTILAWQSFKQVEDSYGKEKAMITRDNLSNQFVGKGRSSESAENIVKYFGKHDVIKENISSGESGESISFQNQKEDVLQVSDIVNQPIGHFTGVLADGKPPVFHTQFDDFRPELSPIPIFSKKWNTGDESLDSEMMKKEVEENYNRVEREINELMKTYEKV